LQASQPVILQARKVTVRGKVIFEFKIDPDPADDSLDFFWKAASKLNGDEHSAMLLLFLGKVSEHSPDRDGYRHSVLTLRPCGYADKTTKGHVTVLLDLFLNPDKMNVLWVKQPTPLLGPTGAVLGVLSRAFKVGAFRTAQSNVVFGHTDMVSRNKIVTCDCSYFQKQLEHRIRDKSIHWCKHVCFLLMKAGFLPGHAFYYQAGFTTNEMDLILSALEFVTIDTRHNNLELDEWVLQKGSTVNATCAASYSKSGCTTQKESGGRQPILPPKVPRVVVQGKKRLGVGEDETWVTQKIQFCPVKKCVFCILPKWFKVSRPPADGTIIALDGVEVTREVRLKSGGLIFV